MTGSVRALTVEPGRAGSARVEDRPAPDAPVDGMSEGLMVETLRVGVCGTDAEILAGHFGVAPDGADRLVLGHEAVGRVVAAPRGARFASGDLVVPIVRRPDPEPCASCAVGEWDMCLNGRYTECGIKGIDGFAVERFVLDAAFAVAVPADLGARAVLVEPASVIAKAWEQIERIGRRSVWNPKVALITGAGPIGLLAAAMARQRGFETYVVDRVSTGPKPALVEALGARYRTGPVLDAGPRPDVAIECTGAASVVLDVIEHTARTGIACLTGLSSGPRTIELDAAALNRRLVLENDVVFGTVNANRRHYEAAVAALAGIDPAWLDAVVTRAVPLDGWSDAIEHRDDDVKLVIELAA